MNNVISFTPVQFIGTFLAICAGITCIAGAVAVIVKIVRAAKAPNEEQTRRIVALENRCNKFDDLLGNDKRRLDHIEDGSRVTQRAILALLRHGIDGNDIEAMKTAEAELHDFLIKQ